MNSTSNKNNKQSVLSEPDHEKENDRLLEKFIPNIVSNHTHNAILLTVLPAALYTAAAYGSLAITNFSMLSRIIIAIVFAILEYIVRVPINLYSRKKGKLSYSAMQAVWIVQTMAMAMLVGVVFG